jgi:hypothetical protein
VVSIDAVGEMDLSAFYAAIAIYPPRSGTCHHANHLASSEGGPAVHAIFGRGAVAGAGAACVIWHRDR